MYVYDIRQSDPIVASVTDKNEMHRDEVTVLKWIKDPKSSKKKFLVKFCFIYFFKYKSKFVVFLKLLSASKDGKILCWNPLPSKNQLKIIEGFIMLIDYLPRSYFKSLGSEMGGKKLFGGRFSIVL